jgi:hypothetical protein
MLDHTHCGTLVGIQSQRRLTDEPKGTREWFAGQIGRLVALRGINSTKLQTTEGRKLLNFVYPPGIGLGAKESDRANALEERTQSHLRDAVKEFAADEQDRKVRRVTLGALLVLFGIEPGYRDSTQSRRRKDAATALGMQPETIRKKYQELYISALADRLYRDVARNR